MTVTVSLKNLNERTVDEVMIEEVKDNNNFSYLDNEGCICDVSVYNDGINITRHAQGYTLEIITHKENVIRITSSEGTLNLPIKVIDFISNNDILAMHYLLEDEERIVEIKYY